MLSTLLFAAAMSTAPCQAQSLLSEWDRFEQQTRALAPEVRGQVFVDDFATRHPDYYRGLDDAAARARRAARMARYFETRDETPQAALAPADVVAAFAPAEARFRRALPDFDCRTTITFGLSFGSFDGQVWRDAEGRDHLLFGVDVVGRLHTARSLPVLFDHELFHIYHAQQFRETAWFDDDQPLWWGLWMEGLASYASHRMNPDVDLGDVFWMPRDLDVQVDARRAELAKTMLGDIDARAGDGTAYARWFQGGDQLGQPARSGYYLGYRFAEHMGRNRTLADLARLPPEVVRREAIAWLTGQAAAAIPMPTTDTSTSMK
jgi:hypothetical protein